MSGAVGLSMETFAFALQIEHVPAEDWASVTSSVQIMEHETLRLWREQR